MNNRDPFNIRNSYFQSGARFASVTASNLQAGIDQGGAYTKDVLDSAHRALTSVTSASEGMSSAAPRVVASNDGHDHGVWVSRKQSSQNAVSEKLGTMFNSKDELPMYKDKPYNYQASKRKHRIYPRQKLLVALLAFVALCIYWFGMRSNPAPVRNEGKQNSVGFFGSLFSEKAPDAEWEDKREKVVDTFKLSWMAYEQNAWGKDEYHPVSKNGRNMVQNGMGWIIVDALDTLMLMNLTTELMHAREWVSTSLTYDKDHDVNTFETTIRMLGGLLSAHYLATEFPDMAPLPTVDGSGGEDLYLELATDLADRLLGAYQSPSGIPYASINLHTRQGIPSHEIGGASSTAEAATLQLEMKYLASLTGEKNYWDKAEKVIQVMDDNGMKDGLLPIYISADQGTFRGENIRLGSRGDSYYEYLIKQYLQTSKQEPIYLDMWNQALAGIRKHLITYSKRSNLTILAERPNGLSQRLEPKMDHLVCFMPGTIALAATEGLTVAEAKKTASWGAQKEEEMELAKQLMKTCWGMYKVTSTGLAPEIAHFELQEPPAMMQDGVLSSPSTLSNDSDAEWRSDYMIKPADSHNLQRPETAESLFYMWRITGDPIYREWGWEMFSSFVKHTVVPEDGGFSSINDVTVQPTTLRNNMESFWLAETLKYLYLLFSPNDILPLDQIVFNTEAHPFPNFELGKLFSTGWNRKPRDSEGNIILMPSEEHTAGTTEEVNIQTVEPAQPIENS